MLGNQKSSRIQNWSNEFGSENSKNGLLLRSLICAFGYIFLFFNWSAVRQQRISYCLSFFRKTDFVSLVESSSSICLKSEFSGKYSPKQFGSSGMISVHSAHELTYNFKQLCSNQQSEPITNKMTRNHRVVTKEVTDTPRKIPALPFCARGKRAKFFSSKHKVLVFGASLRKNVIQMHSDNSRYEDERIRRRQQVDGRTYGCVQTILHMKMNG